MKDNMSFITKGFYGFNLLRAETHIDTCKGHSKAWLIAMLLVVLMAGCNGSVNLTDVPTISITSPADGSTGVATNAKITAAFSEPMDSKSIDSPETTFTLRQGDTIIAGTVALDSDNVTAVFTPSAALSTGTTYTARITTGAKSLGGKALESDVAWSFTTGVIPGVTLTIPADGATGVAINTKIVAAFSQEMDSSTVTITTFTLKQGSTSVPGTVTYDNAKATFTPSSDLLPNTNYTATITTGIKDLAGNALPSDHVWSFTTVEAGVLGVSPATLTFDNRTVGTTSAIQTVTITNTGGTALTISSVTNSNIDDFVITQPTTLTLNAGATTTFTVAFKPASAGPKSATITVASTAGNLPVNAAGTAVAAGVLSVAPGTLTFGNQTVGTTSAIQTVTISNTGGIALTVSSITIGGTNSGDFILAAPSIPLTINAGEHQTFTVAFQPAATTGTKTATITVTSTVGNATVSVSGTGI